MIDTQYIILGELIILFLLASIGGEIHKIKELEEKMLESEKRFDEAFDKALRYR